MPQNTSPLTNLPDDLAYEVLAKLNPSELARCARVSEQFSKLVSNFRAVPFEIQTIQELLKKAARSGQAGKIQDLIENQQFKYIPLQNGLDQALYEAAENGHVSVIELLIEVPAIQNPNSTLAFTDENSSGLKVREKIFANILSRAQGKNQYSVVKKFVTKPLFQPEGEPGKFSPQEDAFLWATEKEHWDIIKMLVIESTYLCDFIKNHQANFYTTFSNKHVLKAVIDQAEEEKKLNTQTR